MTRSVLVVGASGTVGREVVGSLLQRGAHVRVLVRSTARAAGLPREVEACLGDLADRSSVDRALEGVSGVFFVTPHGPDEERFGRTLVEACEAKPVERVVFSAAIHPSFGNRLLDRLVHAYVGRIGPHYVPKLRVERRVRASRLHTVVLLPSNFFQNDDTFRVEILSGVYPQPLGDEPVSRVDCRDIGDAAARALLDATVEPGAYPLVGPRSYTGAETAAVWAEALGRDVRYAGNDVAVWARTVGDRFDPDKKADFAKTLAILQRYGLPTTERALAATETILGRPARSYEAYVAERARA